MSKRLAIVLAAGMGTRMKSELPKVLCPALGRPMVDFVVDALSASGFERILMVVGYRSDLVRAHLANRPNVEFVEQTERLGTGHAVKTCRDKLVAHSGSVLIVAGDSPLIQRQSTEKVMAASEESHAACILGTLHKTNPTGLGRIVRNERGDFVGIVEEKDATDAQRAITEVNMSTYVFDCSQLIHALDQLKNENKQREYYLTDCPGILKNEGKDVRALAVLQPCEALSVNTVDDLLIVEEEMRRLGYPVV